LYKIKYIFIKKNDPLSFYFFSRLGRYWFEAFFERATLNPNTELITGLICGYRIEEIENPLTKKTRYLDKLVDELAKGKKMEKILRK
jgi:hypothetical protein